MVTLLCDSGASTLIETKDGKTPICYAAAASHTEVLSFLMRKKHDTHNLMDDKKVFIIKDQYVFLEATSFMQILKLN